MQHRLTIPTRLNHFHDTKIHHPQYKDVDQVREKTGTLGQNSDPKRVNQCSFEQTDEANANTIPEQIWQGTVQENHQRRL